MKVAGFAVLALAAVPAMAAAQATDKPEAAEESKPMTRAEISEKLDADYADLDGDKDGKVTPEEINRRLVKSAEADLEEIRKKRDETFARLDANGDGSISREEFDEKAKLPTIKEPDAKPFLDQFDKDKDGTISRDEFRAPTLTNFDKLDANKDGTLSPAERDATSAPTAAAVTKKPAVKKTPPMGR